MDRTEQKIADLRRATNALRLEVPAEIMDDFNKKVEAVIVTTLEWRRRAASHGCNLEEGDKDCG